MRRRGSWPRDASCLKKKSMPMMNHSCLSHQGSDTTYSDAPSTVVAYPPDPLQWREVALTNLCPCNDQYHP